MWDQNLQLPGESMQTAKNILHPGTFNFPVLERWEEEELARRFKEERNLDARDRLIQCNLRGVAKIAMEYHDRGVSFEDLLQEGSLGLYRAIEKFDPDRGVRLLSYAGWWIRAYMKEAILKQRFLVRIGTTQNQRTVFSGLGKARLWLIKEHPEITDSEQQAMLMAEHLEVPLKDFLETAQRLDGKDLSLNAPIDDNGSGCFLDKLESGCPEPDEVHAATQCSQQVRIALSVLTPRESLIIQERLLVQETQTLEELGQVLGISRERVRQLEVRAKEKLRPVLADLANDMAEF